VPKDRQVFSAFDQAACRTVHAIIHPELMAHCFINGGMGWRE
jgi:hypothetical protein